MSMYLGNSCIFGVLDADWVSGCDNTYLGVPYKHHLHSARPNINWLVISHKVLFGDTTKSQKNGVRIKTNKQLVLQPFSYHGLERKSSRIKVAHVFAIQLLRPNDDHQSLLDTIHTHLQRRNDIIEIIVRGKMLLYGFTHALYFNFVAVLLGDTKHEVTIFQPFAEVRLTMHMYHLE